MLQEPWAGIIAWVITIGIVALFVLGVRWLLRRARAAAHPSDAQTSLNFKFTPKSTAIFVAGLFASAVVNVLSGTKFGFGILLIVVIYLAISERARNRNL